MSGTLALSRGTYLDPEKHAYPNGGQTRAGRAVYPDGKVRRVWAGIPETYFSIPAHGWAGGRYVAGRVTITDASDQDRYLSFRPRVGRPGHPAEFLLRALDRHGDKGCLVLCPNCLGFVTWCPSFQWARNEYPTLSRGCFTTALTGRGRNDCHCPGRKHT